MGLLYAVFDVSIIDYATSSLPVEIYKEEILSLVSWSEIRSLDENSYRNLRELVR